MTLPRELLRQPAHEVAPRLLGTRLVVSGDPLGRVVLRIVEVEAYGGAGEDPGSHAHRGRTRRNATMFAEPGLLYVYLSYGIHWCLNVTCHEDGGAGAVLLRAAEVLQGADAVRARRTTSRSAHDLASGPGRLGVAVRAGGGVDGVDLCDETSPLRLEHGPAVVRVGCGPRVGVSGEGARTPWRWWDAESRSVSAYRAAAPRRRRGRPGSDGTGGT